MISPFLVSEGVDEEIETTVGVSALSSFQRFDTVGWVTETASSL